ncbi:19562_t:CDS:1, partial [Racocetra persica]
NVKNLTPEQAKNSNTQLLREQHAKYLTSKANSLEVLSTSFEFSFSLNTKNIKQEEICKELEKLSLNNE